MLLCSGWDTNREKGTAAGRAGCSISFSTFMYALHVLSRFWSFFIRKKEQKETHSVIFVKNTTVTQWEWLVFTLVVGLPKGLYSPLAWPHSLMTHDSSSNFYHKIWNIKLHYKIHVMKPEMITKKKYECLGSEKVDQITNVDVAVQWDKTPGRIAGHPKATMSTNPKHTQDGGDHFDA